MHYFEKMSASRKFAPLLPPEFCPFTPLGNFRSSDPLITHPYKILQAPMSPSSFFYLFIMQQPAVRQQDWGAG